VRVDFQSQFAAPPGAGEVLLVRHGSCDAPAPDGLIGGRSDPPLNEAGRAQAAAVADRLAGTPMAALLVTPLRRTAETAAELVARNGHEARVVPELNEVFLGEWEGHEIHRRGSIADPEFVKVMAGGYWDVIPGAESRDSFSTRVRAGLEIAADAARDGEPAVAVTHSGVIAEFLRQITGADPFAFLTCSNGSISRVVRMPDGRWVLVSFNDTSHLSS
jgi:2,3-bisphosphoglycerate-dependent phosphoglycerate mutase